MKEHKKKNQDLNAKLYSLRTQKTELDNKVMEMRSTIGSLKDEQRALELTIGEKESKINDLKTSLHSSSSPPKIWSVSSDDPSNREANLTSKVTTTINPSVHEDDVKSKMKNTTMDAKEKEKETRVYEENGGGLSMKGNRSFIGRKSEAEKKDEDEGETEAMIAADADQDYKEETED